MNVVFLDSDTLPVALPVRSDRLNLICRRSTSPDEILEALIDADAVVTNKVRLERRVLEQLPRLRYVCVAATGYDCVDLAACRDLGIAVSNVPAYSTQSVAEAVIAMAFALRRRLFEYQKAAREHWSNSTHFSYHGGAIQDLHGATLGVVGRGAIGNKVGQLGAALGMRVLFAEHRDVEQTRDGYTAFQEVLQKSDVITLHCPLTPQTHHLIDRQALGQMAPGALLINTARGALVDEGALLDALSCGTLGGAGLDVLDKEPPAVDHPLLQFSHPNLIVTPHVGWASRSSLAALAQAVIDNLETFAQGEPCNLVS